MNDFEAQVGVPEPAGSLLSACLDPFILFMVRIDWSPTHTAILRPSYGVNVPSAHLAHVKEATNQNNTRTHSWGGVLTSTGAVNKHPLWGSGI